MSEQPVQGLWSIIIIMIIIDVIVMIIINIIIIIIIIITIINIIIIVIVTTYNVSWTEWSAIPSVIIRVLTKKFFYHEYDNRPKSDDTITMTKYPSITISVWKMWCKGSSFSQFWRLLLQYNN